MNPNKPAGKQTEIARIAKAFSYSMQGFKAAFKEEPAFKTEVIAGLFLIPFGLYFAETVQEASALIISAALVYMMELVNSAIEAVVDRIGPEVHELSGRAKDIGSAAVFVALVVMAVVWVMILLPKFI